MGLCGLMLLAALAREGLAQKADVPPKVSARVKKHLGEKTIEILNGSTRVEVFRVAPARNAKADDKQVGGHRITATGKERDQKFAARLAVVLQRDDTLFGTQARCFVPGVAFRLWQDKEGVEVLICFTCENLRIIARDDRGKEIKNVSGAFGPDRAPLLKLVKEAFPDDKEIQAIREKR
jgi:hypothetical protein